jgi:hypothetical protein
MMAGRRDLDSTREPVSTNEKEDRNSCDQMSTGRGLDEVERTKRRTAGHNSAGWPVDSSNRENKSAKLSPKKEVVTAR